MIRKPRLAGGGAQTGRAASGETREEHLGFGAEVPSKGLFVKGLGSGLVVCEAGRLFREP